MTDYYYYYFYISRWNVNSLHCCWVHFVANLLPFSLPCQKLKIASSSMAIHIEVVILDHWQANTDEICTNVSDIRKMLPPEWLCVWVNVCVWKREREREREGKSSHCPSIKSSLSIHNILVCMPLKYDGRASRPVFGRKGVTARERKEKKETYSTNQLWISE